MSELELTLVAEGLKFPEGPIAMRDGSVILTEIEGRRVIRVAPDGKIKVVAEIDGGPNGLAVGPDNALYLANNGGALQFHVRGGVNAAASMWLVQRPGSTRAAPSNASTRRQAW